MKTARLNWNQTRLAAATSPSTPPMAAAAAAAAAAVTPPPTRIGGGGGRTPAVVTSGSGNNDCQCRPEEFTCPASAHHAAASGASGRRKGQLSFSVKVL